MSRIDELHARRIEPAERSEPSFDRPLTFIEREVWKTGVVALRTNPAFGTLRSVLRIAGPLDTGALERAIEAHCARHDIYRTSYHARGEDAVALVEPVSPDVAHHDVADEDALAPFIAEQTARGFELSRAPLSRFVIVRVRPDLHYLLVVAHHIVADGYSFQIVFRELASLYEAMFRGTAPTQLPVVQYSDVARWEEPWHDPVVVAEHEAFWKTHHAATTLPRPIARMAERPVGQQWFGAAHYNKASALSCTLSEFCRARLVTKQPVLLAVRAALGREEGENGATTGTILNTRGRTTMRTVGNFAKFLPFRLSTRAGVTLTELLHETRLALTERERYRVIAPEFTPLDHALGFRTTFNSQTIGFSDLPFGEATAHRAGSFEKHRMLLDVELHCLVDAQDQFSYGVDYNADLIPEPVLVDYVDRYDALLSAAMAEPDRPLEQLARA